MKNLDSNCRLNDLMNGIGNAGYTQLEQNLQILLVKAIQWCQLVKILKIA